MMKLYRTLQEIEELISLETGEDVHLEFKQSDILMRRQTGDLVKEITAFANSDGGSVIIGLAENKETGVAERLDAGVPSKLRAKEWIYQCIQSNIHPSLSGVTVTEIAHGENYIIVIDVPKSSAAPHQSQDKRYYRRHASQSYPMDDYEIEDLRARSANKDQSVQINLVMHEMVYFFSIQNPSNAIVDNFSSDITTNFDSLFEDRHFPISPIKLRHLRPGQLAEYIIGSAYELFQVNKQPHLKVDFSYTFNGTECKGTEEFFFSDYATQSVVRSEIVTALDEISRALSKIEGHQRQLNDYIRDISRPFNSSGIKLSSTTLRSLINRNMPKHDPFITDGKGFSDILGVDINTGYKLYSIFGVINAHHSFRDAISALPVDIQDGLKDNFMLYDPDE